MSFFRGARTGGTDEDGYVPICRCSGNLYVLGERLEIFACPTLNSGSPWSFENEDMYLLQMRPYI
jgi:hypothetical protein